MELASSARKCVRQVGIDCCFTCNWRRNRCEIFSITERSQVKSSISTIRCQRKGMTDSKMGFYKYSAISIESVLNLTSQVCDSRLTATLLSPMTIAKKEYQLLYSLQLQKYIKLLALTIRITVWLISTNSARL